MLKFVNTDVVFQEIPDEVTLAVNLSGCPCHCPGCHSPYLWDDVGEELTPAVIDTFSERYGDSITCICLMGGDADPQAVCNVAQYIHNAHPQYKVGWYSGRVRVPATVTKSLFDYIKVGPYIRHLGPLKQSTTNQRLYRKNSDGQFEDITFRFWHNSAQ